MSVLKTLFQFKERYNKLDSNHYRDLTNLQIDQAINDGVFIFLENNVFPELHQQKFDMVSNLIVTQPEQTPLLPVSTTGNIYEFDLTQLKYPYLHYKRAFVETNCGNYRVEIVGHGRLDDIINDAFQKPSKKWRRLLGKFSKNSTKTTKSLYIYSDENFIVANLSLEYIRKPKDFFSGGYDTLEYLDCVRQSSGNNSACNQFKNASSSVQDLEIDENYHTLIVDYAVKEASRILKDGGSFQLQNDKLNTIINA